MPFLLAQTPPPVTQVRPAAQLSGTVAESYTKQEAMIPMRDGTKLYTAIYAPKDNSQKWPILMERTAYGNLPYGPTRLRPRLGPSPEFQKRGYIFVYQDVRGRWRSEGRFVYSSPPKSNHKGTEFDESTDAYDTIEWLLKNVPNNNGKVGLCGISQDGFYATHSLLSGHPAIKAVSPQAPVTDRYRGDDDHHNGAYFLAQRFNLLYFFGVTRPIPTEARPPNFRIPGLESYSFFLNLGPLPNYEKIFQHRNQHWELEAEHPNYDAFWQSRGMEQYLRALSGPAVLTVGGFYDAEDLYGALHTFQALNRHSPRIESYIVMGPWSHGMWAGGDAERMGPIEFGSKTAKTYREEIELPFFEHYLRDVPMSPLPKATMFETGTNRWCKFDQWPPRTRPSTLWLRPKGVLSATRPSTKERPLSDAYMSDPRRPVPFTNSVTTGVPTTFMLENQRFAWLRPDVLSYQTDPLKDDMTLAGPIHATLNVSTTGTDSDFFVKVIDVYPDTEPANINVTPNVPMAGYQMLVRWEVMRGRYRNSLEHPEPMVPGQMTKIRIDLNDVLHTFRKGHRLMVQVQSSMFPLVDINPQTYVNIYKAKETDFHPAIENVAVSGPNSSQITFGILPNMANNRS